MYEANTRKNSEDKFGHWKPLKSFAEVPWTLRYKYFTVTVNFAENDYRIAGFFGGDIILAIFRNSPK
jgi:hypothetical protein